jgi:hypothetical protein
VLSIASRWADRMSPASPAQRADGQARRVRSSGSLSARQWQDIRQAARLARSEGVTLALHGVRISGGEVPAAASVRQQTPRSRPLPGTGNSAQPMEFEGGAAPTATRTTSKQRRDAGKLEAFLERKRAERWLPFVQSLLKAARWKHQQVVWTTWMRSRISPKRVALRNIFWRAWTLRDTGGSTVDPVLGLTSRRDEYIHAKARLLCRRHIEPEIAQRNLRESGPNVVMDDMADFGLSGFDPTDVQAAITASLRTASGVWLEEPAAPEDDTTARHPGGRSVGKSSLTEAGLQAPSSARAGKKRSGRRR